MKVFGQFQLSSNIISDTEYVGLKEKSSEKTLRQISFLWVEKNFYTVLFQICFVFVKKLPKS